MAVLSVSDSLSEIISKKIERTSCWMQPNLDTFIEKDEHFLLIVNAVKKLLVDDKFVILRNIGFSGNKSVFESFVKLFGSYYGTVEHTGIHLECKYTGCSYRPIELHNDNPIDENYSRYGFIQSVKQDPNGDNYAWNGIVRIDDVVKYLEIHDKQVLAQLLELSFPMFSMGLSVYAEDKSERELKLPILYIENNEYKTRFSYPRIKYYYFIKKIEMPENEKKLIENFLNVCRKLRQRYLLSLGDILIHDNHRTLHDREEATLEIDENGYINSREIIVSFAK